MTLINNTNIHSQQLCYSSRVWSLFFTTRICYTRVSVCIQTLYNVAVFWISYFTIRYNPWMFKESSHLIFPKVFFEDIHTLPAKYSVTCVQMTKDTLGHYLLVLSWLIFQYYVLQWSHIQYSNNDQGDQLFFSIELRRVWRYQIPYIEEGSNTTSAHIPKNLYMWEIKPFQQV